MNDFNCYLKFIRIIDTPMMPDALEKMEQEQTEKKNGSNQPTSTCQVVDKKQDTIRSTEV